MFCAVEKKMLPSDLKFNIQATPNLQPEAQLSGRRRKRSFDPTHSLGVRRPEARIDIVRVPSLALRI
jgi:hypothetical protein